MYYSNHEFVFRSYLGNFPFANLTIKAIEAVAADIDNFLPKPYAGEMRGNIPYKQFVLFIKHIVNVLLQLRASDTIPVFLMITFYVVIKK